MRCRYRLFFLFIIPVSVCSCGQSGQDYFPLGNHYSREYVIEEKVNDQREILKSVGAELEPITIEGSEYYPRRYANGKTYYFKKSEAGISVVTEPGQPGKIILGFPFLTGTTWQTETRVDILHRRHESFSGGESFISPDDKIMLDFHIAGMDDTVRVPAGEYTHCMRIEGNGSVKVDARTRGIDHIRIEETEWYAKGVGLVRRKRTEMSIPEKYRGELVQELVSVKK